MAYNIFMVEDHTLHVYVLGGPDFIVGPTAPREQRNILGVIDKVGKEGVIEIEEGKGRRCDLPAVYECWISANADQPSPCSGSNNRTKSRLSEVVRQ